jgi:hypothetical protein
MSKGNNFYELISSFFRRSKAFFYEDYKQHKGLFAY